MLYTIRTDEWEGLRLNRARNRSVPGSGSFSPPLVVALGVALLARTAFASEEGGGHVDVFSFVLVELAAIIALAGLGRWAAARFGQPSVLGELLAGIIAGNVGVWLGRPLFVARQDAGELPVATEERHYFFQKSGVRITIRV